MEKHAAPSTIVHEQKEKTIIFNSSHHFFSLMESPLVAIYCLLNFIIHRAAVIDSEETTSDFLAAYFKVKIDSL